MAERGREEGVKILPGGREEGVKLLPGQGSGKAKENKGVRSEKGITKGGDGARERGKGIGKGSRGKGRGEEGMGQGDQRRGLGGGGQRGDEGRKRPMKSEAKTAWRGSTRDMAREPGGGSNHRRWRREADRGRSGGAATASEGDADPWGEERVRGLARGMEGKRGDGSKGGRTTVGRWREINEREGRRGDGGMGDIRGGEKWTKPSNGMEVATTRTTGERGSGRGQEGLKARGRAGDPTAKEKDLSLGISASGILEGEEGSTVRVGDELGKGRPQRSVVLRATQVERGGPIGAIIAGLRTTGMPMGLSTGSTLNSRPSSQIFSSSKGDEGRRLAEGIGGSGIPG
ncbi:hypothetical protein AMTRI_Chr11g151890 [Amborella trichopoda]